MISVKQCRLKIRVGLLSISKMRTVSAEKIRFWWHSAFVATIFWPDDFHTKSESVVEIVSATSAQSVGRCRKKVLASSAAETSENLSASSSLSVRTMNLPSCKPGRRNSLAKALRKHTFWWPEGPEH